MVKLKAHPTRPRPPSQVCLCPPADFAQAENLFNAPADVFANGVSGMAGGMSQGVE